MSLPLDVARTATAGVLMNEGGAPAHVRISTDTRALAPGDTFLALRGERFDGHEFVNEAVGRGAAMLVLDRAEVRPPGVAALIVERTDRAYAALALAARTRFAGRVVAVTGSSGKTTTRTLLGSLLEARYPGRVLEATGNENNEIGVASLMLQANDAQYDVVVAELGARHYGDIATLVDIARPDVGILTNIGDAHLEIMGSRERLEATKWALFGRGAAAVLNAGDAASRRRAGELRAAVRWFAAVRDQSADVVNSGLHPLTALIGNDELLEQDRAQRRRYGVDVRLPGLHNRANLAAALAAALELGLEMTEMVSQLASLQLPAGRYERLALDCGLQIVYDAYNANAAGMIAALDTFAAEPADRRIAVLASMAELGTESQALHERVGAHAAKVVDVLLVGGEYADALSRGARAAGLAPDRIVDIEDNAWAARWLREHATGRDVILLKGSRKYRLEEIVTELQP